MKESLKKMKEERREMVKAWRENLSNTGYNRRRIHAALEEAGAVGIVTSYWSKEYGSNKIFGATTKKIPVVDLSLEDYGMVYRLAQSGQKPELNIIAQSSGKGMAPAFKIGRASCREIV